MTGSTNMKNNIEMIPPKELDEDGLNKLKDYKSKLGNELNEIIQQEKEKEEDRLKNYTNEADEEIKKILEDAINKDRVESSKRVMSFNE